ncbi:aquaporin-4-like [Pomacea canaliculata]|nr:aquaporin-4-like [Pomacea canaliculata]
MTFKRLNFWKSVKCEFMMTLFYVLFGCGATSSVLVSQNTKDLDVALMSQYAAALNAALAFGLTAAIMLHCSLRLEGPVHLNPAVTVALLCTRRVNVVTALFHIMAQCLGALAGSGVLYGVTPARLHDHLGVTMVMGNTGRGQAFGFEFVSTFVLVFAYYSSCEPGTLRFKPLPIGLAISAGTLFSWQYTGASMNPARSLGPAVVCNEWRDHWVYWIGPILGGMLGGITYEYSHWSGPDTPGSSARRFSCPGATGMGLEHSGSKDSVEDTPTELTYTVNMADDPEV